MDDAATFSCFSPRMNGKVCLVTGSNAGIGLETARALARRGAVVVMAGRNRARVDAAVDEVRRTTGNDRVEALDLDLESMGSVRSAAEAFRARHSRLHVLVNNAGLMLSERRVTVDGFEATLAINHLGHFLLTNLLGETLAVSAPSRVVNVSSNAHKRAGEMRFDDLMLERRYNGLRAYAQSKLANVLFTRELARRWKDRGVAVNALHPGVVNTRITADGDAKGMLRLLWDLGRPFMLTPEQGARTTIHVATSREGGEVTGEYFEKSRRSVPGRAAQDDSAARRLWEESERLLGSA